MNQPQSYSVTQQNQKKLEVQHPSNHNLEQQSHYQACQTQQKQQNKPQQQLNQEPSVQITQKQQRQTSAKNHQEQLSQKDHLISARQKCDYSQSMEQFPIVPKDGIKYKKELQNHENDKKQLSGIKQQQERDDSEIKQKVKPDQYHILIQKINKRTIILSNSLTDPNQPIINTPKLIELPNSSVQLNQSIKQVSAIIPCTIQKKQQVNKSNNFKIVQNLKSEQSMIEQAQRSIHANNQQNSHKNFDTITQSHAQTQKKNRQNLEMSRSKVMTGLLLDKIQQLQMKIKHLEDQKNNFGSEKANINEDYNSTPLNRQTQFGSIRRLDQSPHTKEFQTVAQKNQGSSFRVRNLSANKSLSSSNNRIHSNIYNMTVLQLSHENQIKQEIKALKEKLYALENNYDFNDKSIKQSIHDNNRKILENSMDSKSRASASPDRGLMKGKIVKRNPSTFLPVSEKSNKSFSEDNIMPTPKGFIRNSPAIQIVKQATQQDFENQQIQLIDKKDSSAIFRKSTGPVIGRKTKDLDNSQNSHQFKQFQTLEFNPQKQKLVLDSKDTQQLLYSNTKKEPISPIQKKSIQQIYIPHLQPFPTPKNTQNQLIEIGKLTFKKLGCEITQSTQLYIRKYKNCIHFSIAIDKHILWHYEGKFYFGGWKSYANGQGQKMGEGIQYFPGKYKFKGFFVDGKRSGYGILILEKDGIYVGQWQNGMKCGNGRQIDSDGFIYEGQWKDGKKNGYGKMINNGKVEFQGVFMKGLKNGYGKENFQNGDTYDGNYVNNKFDGKGTYRWRSGAIYVGDFQGGQRHGYGVWRTSFEGGDVYEGQYKKDQKHGKGVYTWQNGSVYEGNFKDDFKHGQGTMTYENGKVAHLFWEKGKVQKKIQLSSRKSNQPQNSYHGQRKANNHPSANLSEKKFSSNMAYRATTPMKRNTFTKSHQKIQSAKSTSSLPRGITYKKSNLERLNNPLTNKAANDEFVKIKLGPSNRGARRPSANSNFNNGGPPRDPPYRGMQTTTNINMNV